MITVIIPYYQRSEGILRKALGSIAKQADAGLQVHVVVVDDASPVPAGPEIAAVPDAPFSLQLVQQANGGPGAARNTGLDNVPTGTRYIAFLDSDDEWSADHLSRSVQTLDAGFDFYFADHYQLGQTVSAFARAARLQADQYAGLANLPADLYAYQGDMLDQIIRGNLIGTSTVVYNYKKFSTQRFKVEFTNAGEDYLFWMELVQQGAKIAFSMQSEATYGKGVNVYAGSGWGSEQYLLRIHNELKYRRTTARLFSLSVDQQAHIRSCLHKLRIEFIRGLINRMLHREKISWSLLGAHFRLDPATFISAPIILLNLMRRK